MENGMSTARTGAKTAGTVRFHGSSCTCKRGFRTYLMKIFEIKEDICYVIASVAGQRGRLLFQWTQSPPRLRDGRTPEG